MTGGADEAAGPLRDVLAPAVVTRARTLFTGRVWDVVEETFDLGEAGTLTREVVDHPGAVAVLALDEADRVLLIRQYRHPVGMHEWELPAGILDVVGEPPQEAAARELHEETDHTARTWHVLADHFSSPGGLNEALRIFLARDLAPVPDGERHEREGEERGMPVRWVPLDEARDAVLAGGLHNPTLVIGIHTAYALRERGWAGLRPADAPWPEHPRLRAAPGG
ncbi:MAG TPA: NUDIX hydrolase [Dermatophilaceae bacterium]|nr:NUDIX hydrolase [Dermatophilaceae bacterium]